MNKKNINEICYAKRRIRNEKKEKKILDELIQYLYSGGI